ncbi:WhiB family transcriptional regulator [Nocardia sp. NPDC127526]|uniref:WhiB family transcriptional regulator n=1 Tax=Nocardia sp. NPDC127526 TaxID=3345393 RepID=UPI00363B3CB0
MTLKYLDSFRDAEFVAKSGRRPCNSVDPEIFFPAGGHDRASRTAYARSMCGKCPALRQCATEALRLGINYGVVATVDLGDGNSSRQSFEARRTLRAIANGKGAASKANNQ